MTTALFTHPDCLLHDNGPGHPEQPDRLRAVLRALEHPDFAHLLREEAPLATREQLGRIHPARYVNRILSIQPEPGTYARLDADTAMNSFSATAALRAAGGACAAVDAVMEGWAHRAFAAVRPPGHHAEPAQAMGFCFFATAAVAAAHARARWGLERVAVCDFDVHHGNGTQACFERDGALFLASSHQHPCYPGTGMADEQGVGNIVNMPLPPGTAGPAFLQAWDRVGLPALHAFRPDLIIISAGFDSHRMDPLAEMRLDTADFGAITARLVDAADALCGGRLVSVLEGGYDLPALAASAAAHVRALMRI